MIRKSWCIFWLAEILAAALSGVITGELARHGVYSIIPAVIFIILSVIWLWYYNTLKCVIRSGEVIITSGIVFHKVRRLKKSDILWEMHLSLPFIRRDILTVLHTSGGSAAIFGEISTLPG